MPAESSRHGGDDVLRPVRQDAARFSDRARGNPVIRPAELAALWGCPDELIEALCCGFQDDSDAGFY